MSGTALHRAWLHALEDDPAVPYYALHVARVYADFAASAKGKPVLVTWSVLKRCTHMRNDRMSQSLRWLRDRGWLTPEPSKRGGRQYHQLTFPDVIPLQGRAPDGTGLHPV